MKKKILIMVLFMFLIGVFPVFAETINANIYIIRDNDFKKIGFGKIQTNNKMYSISDTCKIMGIDDFSYEEEIIGRDTKSTYFFEINGNLYDIRNKIVNSIEYETKETDETEDKTNESNKIDKIKEAWKIIEKNLTSVDKKISFITKNEDIYIDINGLKAIFNQLYEDPDGNLNLIISPCKEFAFIKNSHLTKEQENLILKALWELYWNYSNGYKTVTENSLKFKVLDHKELNDCTNSHDDFIAEAFVWNHDKSAIHLCEELFNNCPIGNFAAILVHEAYHMKELKETGTTTETEPTVEQTKTMIALGKNTTSIKYWLKGLRITYEYQQGAKKSMTLLNKVLQKGIDNVDINEIEID